MARNCCTCATRRRKTPTPRCWCIRTYCRTSDYNDFLESADALVECWDWKACCRSRFHPQYQFADSDADDIANCTNRSPFPTLHLLREDSIDRAVAAYPDPDVIVERNIATLQALGHAGWQRVLDGDKPH